MAFICFVFYLFMLLRFIYLVIGYATIYGATKKMGYDESCINNLYYFGWMDEWSFVIIYGAKEKMNE